jgi:undecaprenyl diphosphate synthase
MPSPRHLAVIPDGNRRWARARGLIASDGHRAGIANVGPIAEAAWAAGIETFTFWWGSPANLTKRDSAEVAVIVDALASWLAHEAPPILARAGATFEIHGRWEELCPSLRPGVEAARNAASHGPRRLVALMAYDGREEIVAAADRLHGSGGGVDAFGRALWTGALPPVDLLIRTGGEPHLSAGFLTWGIANAQLAFVDAPWPAFTPALLAEEIDRYARTERRFGA